MDGVTAPDSPDRTGPDQDQAGGASAGSAPSEQGAGVRRRKGRRVVRPGAGGDPVIPARSADDSDLGWHEGADTNDERLRRDVPPHW